jgi:hypothetical protein
MRDSTVVDPLLDAWRPLMFVISLFACVMGCKIEDPFGNKPSGPKPNPSTNISAVSIRILPDTPPGCCPTGTVVLDNSTNEVRKVTVLVTDVPDSQLRPRSTVARTFWVPPHGQTRIGHGCTRVTGSWNTVLSNACDVSVNYEIDAQSKEALLSTGLVLVEMSRADSILGARLESIEDSVPDLDFGYRSLLAQPNACEAICDPLSPGRCLVVPGDVLPDFDSAKFLDAIATLRSSMDVGSGILKKDLLMNSFGIGIDFCERSDIIVSGSYVSNVGLDCSVSRRISPLNSPLVSAAVVFPGLLKGETAWGGSGLVFTPGVVLSFSAPALDVDYGGELRSILFQSGAIVLETSGGCISVSYN